MLLTVGQSARAYGGGVDDQRRLLAQAYWRHHQMSGGERAQRVAADGHWWAVEAVEDAVRTRAVGQVVDLLDQLLGAPQADPVFLGAGPLEDLLTAHPEAAASVAERCERSPHAPLWRRAVAAVWLSGYHHDRVPGLARFLSPAIDRP